MLLSDVSIKRPVFATMMMAALVTLGLFSYQRLAIDQWPDISFPFVVVQVPYPGASPETVERDVTRKIEEAVNPIDGVKNLTSSSLEGLSTVFIEFELNVNDLDAQQDVRSKIDQIRDELPEDIDTPRVLRFDPQEIPIFSLAVGSKTRTLRELTTLADETIRKELESVDGVGQVTLIGGEKRAIIVNLDPDRLAARAVPVSQVAATLAAENMEVPAGHLEEGPSENLVRIAGRLTNPADFDRLVVDVRGGVPIRLGDVAQTVDAAEEARSAALFNGVPSIGIDLRKVSGANTVEVADRIKAKVTEIQRALPSGVELTTVRDNSVWIRSSVEDVKTTILLGALLTILVVFTFLNSWRSTVITGLTLPVSVIAAFLAIYVFHYTLNMMTLMALSLATGILIDDAIVVRENIVRHVGKGEGHKEAAKRGTSEIGLAVLATTMSTLCVFIPVAFMGGIVGRFFREFGITVACAVAVSLFVSFTLDPMLSSVWYDPVAEGKVGRGRIGRALERFDHGFKGLTRRYRGVIGWALGHRRWTLGIAAATFVLAIFLLRFVGGTFMPDADSGELSVLVKTPVGSTLDYTRDRVQEVSALLRMYPDVDYTYETIAGGYSAQVNEGEIYVKLIPKGSAMSRFLHRAWWGIRREEPRRIRSITQKEMARVFRREIGVLPGFAFSVVEGGGFGGAQKPLEFYVKGDQIDELRRVSDQVLDVVRRTPGAIEAESGLEEERPEVRIEVRRDLASEMGIGIRSLAGTLRPALAGQTASTWEDPTGEEHDVILRLPRPDRATVAQLSALPIAAGVDPSSGVSRIIQLRQVADISQSTSPQEIERRGMKRVVTILANYDGRPESEVARDIERGVAKLSMPAGYSVSAGGETEMRRESNANVFESLILAIVFIYLVLASEFGSFLQPLAIMLSLPLSLVGVIVTLLLTGTTFNIMSMIGLILLMGLVTKNAILLVDFTNQARQRGLGVRDALIEAGQTRLRPIVMTTLAMIFGMLPLALGIGSGAEFRAPMARAVIGGLITSSLLTLVVIPVSYTIFDDIGRKCREFLTRTERKYKTEEVAAAARR